MSLDPIRLNRRGVSPQDSTMVQLLLQSEVASLCKRTNCTTCGGMPFAEKVVTFLRRRGYNIPRLPVRRSTQDFFQLWKSNITQHAILSELRDLQPAQSDEDRVMPAVRYLIYSVYRAIGAPALEQALPNNSFAARVLRCMEDHYGSRLRAYDSHVNREKNAAIDRVRRLADRQRRHEERLKQKALRDAARLLGSGEQGGSNGEK